MSKSETWIPEDFSAQSLNEDNGLSNDVERRENEWR
jgi:hypothetical protein